MLFLQRLITFRRLKIYDVVIVNWAEKVLTEWGGKLTLRGVAEYRILLWLCRRLSTRLIYVRHNELPHDVPTEDVDRVRTWIDKGEQGADVIIAHSPVYAETRGYAYVPHPLYDVAPASITPSNEYIVFGRVQPYKNIDQLIEAWSAAAPLAIVGPCSDAAYLDKLRALAGDKPVTFDIGFKEETEIAERIAASAGVVISNTPDSVIVSGTLFFALSCGVRVFALATPFHQWLATTPLANAVLAFNSTAALTEAIRQDNVMDAPSAAAIRAEADKLFGDDRVLAAWQVVFDRLFGDAQTRAARRRERSTR